MRLKICRAKTGGIAQQVPLANQSALFDTNQLPIPPNLMLLILMTVDSANKHFLIGNKKATKEETEVLR